MCVSLKIRIWCYYMAISTIFKVAHLASITHILYYFSSQTKFSGFFACLLGLYRSSETVQGQALVGIRKHILGIKTQGLLICFPIRLFSSSMQYPALLLLSALSYDKAPQHSIRLKHLDRSIWINIQNDNRFINWVAIFVEGDLPTYAL